jgi:hypothetical protein
MKILSRAITHTSDYKRLQATTSDYKRLQAIDKPSQKRFIISKNTEGVTPSHKNPISNTKF